MGVVTPLAGGDKSSSIWATVKALLEQSRYEVLPLKSVYDAVSHAPSEARLAVTCSPKKGIDGTLRVVQNLAAQSFHLVPHIAARQVKDKGHLKEIIAECERLGVSDLFVPGGDVQEPAGEFKSSLELLAAMDTIGHSFTHIGVTGYPEGHWLVDDEGLFDALQQKQRFATYGVTQMCFSAETILQWLSQMRARGISLDFYIGLPGVLKKTKLLEISLRLGVGDSLRFLKHNSGVIGQLLGWRPYAPTDLTKSIAAQLSEAHGVKGFHIYTFNQMERAEKWRQDMVSRAPAGQ